MNEYSDPPTKAQRRSRCNICNILTCHLLSWQPFGPNQDATESSAFTCAGAHYRGFPVIKVCEVCMESILEERFGHFTYQGVFYVVDMDIPPTPYKSPITSPSGEETP